VRIRHTGCNERRLALFAGDIEVDGEGQLVDPRIDDGVVDDVAGVATAAVEVAILLGADEPSSRSP
jgi:hypothetical protein